MGAKSVGLPAGAKAFDAIASRYDLTFSPTTNPLVGMVRTRVYRAFARYFPAGGTLLELGCGTGEDTLALTAWGHRIVATDPAPGMIVEARAKLESAGRASDVTFIGHGASDLATLWPGLGLTVDGVFSNFAPLNCELSLSPLRVLLEHALRPGAHFVAVVLPRVCPLEMALALARGDSKTALRRWRREPIADVEGSSFPMRYYGATDFDHALGQGFRRVETRSLGLFLPPLSYGPSFARVPGLLTALALIEDRLSGFPGLRRLGDHVLLAYQRV